MLFQVYKSNNFRIGIVISLVTNLIIWVLIRVIPFL